MSSIVNKVKDALKPGPDTQGDHHTPRDGYDTTGSSGLTGQGSHLATSDKSNMPGGFDNNAESRIAGTSGYNDSAAYGTTSQTGTGHHHHHKHGQTANDTTYGTGTGIGHERGTVYDKKEAAVTGVNPTQQGYTSGTGTSKYGQDPMSTSHDRTARGYGDERGLGQDYSQGQGVASGDYATGAGAGTAASGLTSSRAGHNNTQLSERDVMDPAARAHGSNVMGGTTDPTSGLTGTSSSHHNKLHKKDDPRGYENTTTTSDDYNRGPGLRQKQGETTGAGVMSSSRADRDRDYENDNNNSGANNGPHNSKLLNKLDPRVDSKDTSTSGYDNSGRDHSSRESGITGGTALGSTGAGTDRHSGTQRGYEQGNYSSLPSRNRDEYGTPQQSSGYGDGVQSGSDSRFTSGRHGESTQYRDQTSPNTANYGSGVGSNTYSSGQGSNTYGTGTSTGSSRSGGQKNHFHCMGCGHKNDVSHLKDPMGGLVSGRSYYHCMDCGHRNEVGHRIGGGSSGQQQSAY